MAATAKHEAGRDKAARRGRRPSTTFLVAAVLAILGLLGMATLQSLLHHRDSVEVATRTATNLSQTLAEHTAQALARVDQLLTTVGDTISTIPDVSWGSTRIEDLLRRAVDVLPHVEALMVLDRNGHLIHDSDGTPPIPLDLAERSYFSVHRAQTDRPTGLHVDDLIVDRPTGRVYLPMSRALRDPSGALAGVVVAMVDAEYFRTLFGTLDVGRHGTVAMWTAEGVLIARTPASPAHVGESYPGKPQHADLAERGGKRTGAFRSLIDDITRMTSYCIVPAFPLIVSVALAEDDYLASWRRNTMISAVASLLVTIVIGVFAAQLFRQLARGEAAAARLRESESRFRDFTTAGSDWFWEQDEQLRFTFDSKSGRSPSDATPSEHYGLTRRETEPLGVTEEQWERHLADLAARRPFKDFRYQRIDADGRVHHLSTNGIPVFDEQGRFRGYRGTGRDITSEVEATATLRSVIDAVPAFINAKDTRQRYVIMNAYQARLYGTTPEAAVGRTSGELLGGEYGAHTASFDRQVIETGEPVGFYEERYAAADGVERDWLTAKLPFTDARGQLQLVITVSTEITALKAAQEQLRSAQAGLREAKEAAEAANRAKSEFLANMSHELRTPLNAIIGFSEVMKDGLFGALGSSRYEDYARDIHHSGTHLLELINDILDMAKIEAGKRELYLEEVDCAACIKDAVRLFRERAHDAGVLLRVTLPAELPEVMADRRAIRQILLNLVSNAVKFTAAAGTVMIGARVEADGLHVAVADTGVGIPEDQLELVGTPFFQVDSSTTRRTDGTGLGLALCRSLAAMHGGRLEIASTVGVGTCATIVLPRSCFVASTVVDAA